LAICKGFLPRWIESAAGAIRDVDVRDGSSEFFLAGILDIIGDTAQRLLTLPGVPEPGMVRHSILQNRRIFGARS